jgi:ATP-dependent helicase HepA
MALLPGMKVRYLPQPDWGTGHLLAADPEEGRAAVIFPGRGDEPAIVSTKNRALERVRLDPGQAITISEEAAVIVDLASGDDDEALYLYAIERDGERGLVSEEMIRAAMPSGDLEAMLREGRFGDARDYQLRAQTLRLDDERRCDALGAMFASRVRVQPHQIGVVQRVLSSPRPRFVLADEVGLGKTIEAGMVFSALRLTGLCKRVLVVAPSHLTVQWLIELNHKFNQKFSLLDGSRLRDEDDAIEREAKEKASKIKDKAKAARVAEKLKEKLQEAENPWLTQHMAVTSLELLVRNEEHRNTVASREAFWDLVIIDEAHHLKGDKAFQVAQGLAKNSWGLLLLTATPMHVDPTEYQKLLTLLDERTAPDTERLKTMLDKQAGLATIVRDLMAGKSSAGQALRARFPDDETLDHLEAPDAMLAHVAETYSLSEQLVRNRRTNVGGFAERKLHVHGVKPSSEERALRGMLLSRVKDVLRGAPLATFVRRMDSSLAALAKSVRQSSALQPFAEETERALATLKEEEKPRAFVRLLEAIWRSEPEAKVLIFTEARETLDMLQGRSGEAGYEALVYHGDLSLIERDRQVARFRDPEGPKMLICTEVGGEGRNFQFAHHLVHYDLPWSPGAIEQRIGRLDRIGQTKTVDIHVLDIEGSFAHTVLMLMNEAVSVFTETVGGLDAMLETIEPEIASLVTMTPDERATYGAALKQRVQAARQQVKQGYDPLLDLRSFDAPRLRELLAKAHERLDLDEEESSEDLTDGFWVVARDLDERLEDTVVSLARKVGIQVDTYEQVDAFQAAFHFGYAVSIDALAGIDLHEDRTVLGTFWRETANEQEEIDYFATGHPIVEALFGMVRDGPFGRLALGSFKGKKGTSPRRGFELYFTVTTPEPADTDPGARVPARQLARFWPSQLLRVPLDWKSGNALVLARDLEGVLDRASLNPLSASDEVALSEGFAPMGARALEVGRKVAQDLLLAQQRRVAQAIISERDERLERLTRAMVYQGVSEDERHAVLQSEHQGYEELLGALKTTRLHLDSVLAFLVVP